MIKAAEQMTYATFSQEVGFDKYQLDRIAHLLLLKSTCLMYQSELQVLRPHLLRPGVTAHTSFFLSMSDEVDALIYTFVNDEATTCLLKRGASWAIIDQVLKNDNATAEESAALFIAVKDYLRPNPTYRDQYNGRCFLDFTVSTFSIFETWMGKLYIELRQPESDRRSKRRKKIKALIAEFQSSTDEAEQDRIIDRIGREGGGQTSAGEIDFIFSRIVNYSRPDKEADRHFIKTYAAMRNTVHNMGISKDERDFQMKGPDFDILLPARQASWTADLSDRTRTCRELVLIYAAVIDALDVSESLVAYEHHST